MGTGVPCVTVAVGESEDEGEDVGDDVLPGVGVPYVLNGGGIDMTGVASW